MSTHTTRPLHGDYLADVISHVQGHGATRAFELLAGRPVPSAHHRPHRTLDGYYVWVVDRLLSAGLTSWQLRWHPALHPQSPLAWYDRATLAGRDAHDGFVQPTLGPHDRVRPTAPPLRVVS